MFENFLELKNVTKSFVDRNLDKLNIICGVSLKAKRGEILAISGESGSGKTTLLQIVGTLDLPSSGQVILNNDIISDFNSEKKANLRASKIGFIFQFHNLIEDLNALDNVKLAAILAGIDSKQAEIRAKEILNYVGLKNRYNHLPRYLSGGERQRVAIARSVVNRPALLIADEPTGNLDRKNTDIVINMLMDLCCEYKTICLLASHDQNIIGKMNRKLVMKNGVLETL